MEILRTLKGWFLRQPKFHRYLLGSLIVIQIVIFVSDNLSSIASLDLAESIAWILGGLVGTWAITLVVPAVILLPAIKKPWYFKAVVILFTIMSVTVWYGSYYNAARLGY